MGLGVWALTDGVPGHETRSRGMLAALARLGPVEPNMVPCRLSNRVARGTMVAGFALGMVPPDWVMRACHRMTPPPDRPDIVLAAGGRTQFAALWLGARLGVPTVFAGLPRHVDGRRFSVVICPYPVPGLSNLVELELPLSDIEPEAARIAGAGLRDRARGAPVWTLLAGGDGGGYRYAEADWTALGGWLGDRAAAAGARLCMASSRRTGPVGEAALLTALGRAPLLERAIWGEGARGGLMPMIGAADLVIATADSASMIGEAVAAGRPVVVAEPGGAVPAARHKAVLGGLAARGRIARLPIAGLAGTPMPGDLVPLTVSAIETLAHALAARLDLPPM